MSHLVNQWCTIFLFSVLYKIPVFYVVQNSCFQWCTIFLYEMLYLSLFCLNLSYKSLVVYNSGGGVVPNSVVYKYSDPLLSSTFELNSYSCFALVKIFLSNILLARAHATTLPVKGYGSPSVSSGQLSTSWVVLILARSAIRDEWTRQWMTAVMSEKEGV